MRQPGVVWGVVGVIALTFSVCSPAVLSGGAPNPKTVTRDYEMTGGSTTRVDTVAARPTFTAAAKSPSVSIMLNAGQDRVFGAGETIWIRGRAVDSRNRAMGRKAVKIMRFAGSRASTVATVRTNSQGWYSYAMRASSAVTYRASLSAKQFSPKSTFTLGSHRTLEVRERALAFVLGAARGPVLSRDGLRWRDYAWGTLVQDGARTWLVRGRILGAWQKAGGATGSLGAPIADQRCRLPESACVQNFKGGAVYNNRQSTGGVTTAWRSADVDPTLAAIALSQVGRTIPAGSSNKYLLWRHPDGTKVSWCGIFLSWLAYAAGEPGAVPAAADYPGLIAAIRSNAVLSKEPAVGRLAFISNVIPGKATHAGIVVAVSPGRVTTVEANVASDGGPGMPRGVFRTVHTNPDDIIFYADPLS